MASKKKLKATQAKHVALAKANGIPPTELIKRSVEVADMLATLHAFQERTGKRDESVDDVRASRTRATKRKLTTQVDGLVAVADQALLGTTYARAAILGRHFLAIARELRRENAATAKYVEQAWSLFLRNCLNAAQTPKEKRAAMMVLIDDPGRAERLEQRSRRPIALPDLDGLDEDDALAANDETIEDAVFLRQIADAWKNDKPGRTRKSKWELLEEYSKTTSYFAKAGTWENEALELRRAGHLKSKK